jgi:hypothetical protein
MINPIDMLASIYGTGIFNEQTAPQEVEHPVNSSQEDQWKTTGDLLARTKGSIPATNILQTATQPARLNPGSYGGMWAKPQQPEQRTGNWTNDTDTLWTHDPFVDPSNPKDKLFEHTRWSGPVGAFDKGLPNQVNGNVVGGYEPINSANIVTGSSLADALGVSQTVGDQDLPMIGTTPYYTPPEIPPQRDVQRDFSYKDHARQGNNSNRITINIPSPLTQGGGGSGSGGGSGTSSGNTYRHSESKSDFDNATKPNPINMTSYGEAASKVGVPSSTTFSLSDMQNQGQTNPIFQSIRQVALADSDNAITQKKYDYANTYKTVAGPNDDLFKGILPNKYPSGLASDWFNKVGDVANSANGDVRFWAERARAGKEGRLPTAADNAYWAKMYHKTMQYIADAKTDLYGVAKGNPSVKWGKNGSRLVQEARNDIDQLSKVLIGQ